MSVREKKLRLLVVDDHPIVRYGLRGVLGGQPDIEVVAEAANGAEAVRKAREHRPDVVLMDLRMPEMDGVAATAKVKVDLPEAGVLVLTTYDSDADVVRAVEEGASGFLLKDAPEAELLAAVRSVARGKSPLSPEVASRIFSRMRGAEGDVLSGREVEILRLVARGTSNREIGKELWISEATVKGHLNRVLKKLGAPDRTAAVTEALKRGIIRLE